MHEVKNPGPGSEDVFSCMGLIRSGDAVKGNDADLCVLVGFVHGRLLQISRELTASSGVCLLQLWQNYLVNLQNTGAICFLSVFCIYCGVWRLYLYSKVTFIHLLPPCINIIVCQYIMAVSMYYACISQVISICILYPYYILYYFLCAIA